MYYTHYDEQSGEILGFYTPEMHGVNIPKPNIALTSNQWLDCIHNQGRRKIDPATKKLIVCEPPVPTVEELLAQIRRERDRRIAETIWIFERQMTGTPDQILPDEEYEKWKTYWAALRDFPETCDPYNPVWPTRPDQEGGI